jgi:tRNA dimethylallyltransferase
VSVAPELARIADALAASCADPDRMPAIVGPTGTGKTALACALAERIGGEVVSVDSVQIYRGVNLGSGKPSEEELARAPHHLVSTVDLDAPMDAGRFVALADEAIAAIRARGRRPILCGGTFLWMKAVAQGLAAMPPASEELRAEHARIAESQGRAALHARLREVDPIAAGKLAPNDLVRVSRALEVHALTGKTLSELHAEHGFRADRYPVYYAGVRVDEPRYTALLEARVTGWLAAGWIAEVRALREAGYVSARALGSVGFAEIVAHLDGALALGDLAPAIVRATRVFARRQRTWLRSASVTWFEAPGA